MARIIKIINFFFTFLSFFPSFFFSPQAKRRAQSTLFWGPGKQPLINFQDSRPPSLLPCSLCYFNHGIFGFPNINKRCCHKEKPCNSQSGLHCFSLNSISHNVLYREKHREPLWELQCFTFWRQYGSLIRLMSSGSCPPKVVTSKLNTVLF